MKLLTTLHTWHTMLLERKDAKQFTQELLGPILGIIPPHPGMTIDDHAATYPAPEEQSMSFLSFLGKDVKAVFNWLGSAKGQPTLSTGEAVIESVYPPATGIINLANTWITEAVKEETLATAAGVQTGSGVQKSAAVISAVTPSILTFAKQNGLGTPTAEQIQNANNAIVAFLNAFGAPATPTAPAPPKTA